MSQADIKRGNGSGRGRQPAADQPEEIERDLERTRQQMSDTLSELTRRFTPGDVADELFRYFNTGPGEFARNLGDAVKYNPIPTTLIGIGIAWLAASGRNRPGYAYPPAPEYETAYSNAGEPSLGELGVEAGMYGREYHPGRTESMRRGLREKLSSVREKVSGMRHGAAERMHAASERMHGAREEATERMEGMREGTSERMHEARERMREGAERARGTASRWAHGVRRGGAQAWEQQPLVMGALGIAAGALLGALLPPTRREDELMGEARDRMMGRASGPMGEAAERAGSVVSAAGEEASRQFRKASEEHGWEQGRAGDEPPAARSDEESSVIAETQETKPTQH